MSTKQVTTVNEQVNPKAHAIIIRAMASGADYDDVCNRLQRHKEQKISLYRYLRYCKRPDIIKARASIAEYMLREGVGDRIRRVTAMVEVHDALKTRLLKTIKDPASEPKAISSLVGDFRDVSKQISIEAGDWTENVNIAATVKGMSTQELLKLTSSDVIEGDFKQLEAPAEDVETEVDIDIDAMIDEYEDDGND